MQSNAFLQEDYRRRTRTVKSFKTQGLSYEAIGQKLPHHKSITSPTLS